MSATARQWIVGFAALVVGGAVLAAEPPRPRVGLVLGGGGARGGAHIGVLEVLEDLRIPIDCIAGTSMGALVGGAYAAGISPREITDLVARTDWITMFDDNAGRDSVNLRRKELDDRFYAGIEFGVTRDGLKFREGALAGEKLKLFFNELVRSDFGDRAIESLPLPLAVIATDIGNGQRVAIRTGDLTSAMRGSMSVPGLLSPVLRDGRKLVDGGITDNLPVREVRTLCNPQVVIAVNVGSPLLKPDEVKGIATVLGQVVNLLTEQNVAASLLALNPGDIYIQPELGDIAATDFPRQLEAAEHGRAAARVMAPQLAKLSVAPGQYAHWQGQARLAPPRTPPRVDEVVIAETRFVNPRTLRRGISQEEGKPLDTRRLASDLVREFSQGDLNSLDYSVVSERDRTILRITPVEKPWGPDYLRFGLNFASDLRSESSYNLRALYRKTWLNAYGAEWLLGAQIGNQQSLESELYQPLDLRHVFFLRPYAATTLRKQPVYSNGDRLAIYRVQDNFGGLEAGMNLGVHGQAGLGWVERRIGAVLDTGPNSFFNLTEYVGGPTASLAIDTHDQPFFPTRGFKLDVSHFDAARTSEGSARYSRSEARFGIAASYARWTYLAGLEGGTTLKGTLPLGDAFTLGGPRRLSGFDPGQLLGGAYAFGRLEAQYRLHYASPLWGLTLIAGVLAEAGRMNKPFIQNSLQGTQRSFGAYLAANTFLGPVYIGVADARNGRGRFYLNIGAP